jgi:hypothetical protein
MYFEKTSFGDAEKILLKKGAVLPEVEDIIHTVNTTISWHGQTHLNNTFEPLFTNKGWIKQETSLLKTESSRKQSGQKTIDYRNIAEKIDLEIEFGNVASFYRDIFKFNISKTAGYIEVGIIVLGNKMISNTVGENVASYERFKDELSISWKHGANADCPILLYGLIPLSFPDKRNLIDPNAKNDKKEVQEKRKKRKEKYISSMKGQQELSF